MHGRELGPVRVGDGEDLLGGAVSVFHTWKMTFIFELFSLSYFLGNSHLEGSVGCRMGRGTSWGPQTS